MKAKRGQVTLFIIIAVVVVAVVVSIYFFRTHSPGVQAKVDSGNIQNYIQDSINENTESALLLVGLQGGYINPGQPYFTYEENGVKIAYWYYNLSYFYPDIVDIEKEVTSFVFLNMPNCSELNSKWQEISCEEINIKTNITDENVRVYVKYPLTLKKGETVIKLKSDYDFLVNIRLKDIYDAAMGVVHNYSCLDCLANISLEKDLYITQDYLDNVILNTIEQRDVAISDSTIYNFNFVIQNGK